MGTFDIRSTSSDHALIASAAPTIQRLSRDNERVAEQPPAFWKTSSKILRDTTFVYDSVA